MWFWPDSFQNTEALIRFVYMKKVLLLIGLIYSCFVSAQQGYTFNRISTDDGTGLASNVVYCTYQDAKGFIWVGTANGLQRFDGNKFITFGTSNPESNKLPVADLLQILDAGNGNIWLFFNTRKEVGIFNPTTFDYHIIPIKNSQPIPPRANMRLWKDSKKNVFLTVWKYGIIRFDERQKAFTDENYFPLPAGWKASTSIFEDTLKKRYWFPCPDSGLAVYDTDTKKVYTRHYNPLHIPLIENKMIQPGVTEFFIDRKRRHWVFNWTGAQNKWCFNENGTLLKDTAGINANPEYSELVNFFETKDSVLWVYGANGLFNYDNNIDRFYFYETASAISATGIRYQSANQVMEDRDGSIWIATDNGLYFASTGSGTFNVVNLLFDESKGAVDITDLLQLQTGQYWFSTWGRGIITLDKNFDRYDAGIYNNVPAMENARRIMYNQVWALYQNIDGKVWIGCQAGKYMVHDAATHKTSFLDLKEAEEATIRYITADKKGTIWIATQRGHIIKYDGKTFTTVQKFGTIIPKILIDNSGLLWLATHNQGLYCLTSDGTKILRHYTSDSKTNPLFINSGSDIDQINDSTIAYGAGALNLINLKTGNVSWLTFDDGLPGNTIQRVRADKNGNLWIITLNGLCRYNSNTKRFTPYGRKDGITLANMTTKADYQCTENYIMFTGSNAVMFFLPSIFDNQQPPPDVVITDFKLFNDYVPVDSLLALPKLQLNAHQNSFSIYFSSLSYLQKEKLTYYYKMEGIDKDWIKADGQSFVNYSLLPPGSYTFYVYCENIDGVRSKNITSFRIYIKPPFWRTYWFISSGLFLLSLLLYTLHRMRVNRILAVEKIRNRVARDLHDDMGSTLSTINILSTMAKSRLNTDTVKTSEYISKISENSQRMMEAMDDIVWSIKPMNDNMQKITARMREFATSVLEAKDIEVDFDIEERVYDVKLDMESRRDFFLVFKEAINNAAKYSKANKICVVLITKPGRLELTVKDNGKGFIVAEADTGNGLNNMQKRADAMKGTLQIISKQGEGTTVKLTVPVL